MQFIGSLKRVNSIRKLSQVPKTKAFVKEDLPIGIIQFDAPLEKIHCLFMTTKQIETAGKLLQILAIGRVEKGTLLENLHALFNLAFHAKNKTFEVHGILVALILVLVFEFLDEVHALIVLVPSVKKVQ